MNAEQRLGVYDVQVALAIPDAFSHLLALTVADAKQLFPHSLRALAGLAEAGQRRWQAYARGELTLSSGHKMNAWSGKYMESIKIEVDTRASDGALIAYVISSDDPKAYWLEVGTEPWDMRKILQTSHKVRQTKEGHRYLVIPFRWGTPGTLVVGAYVNREMPESVHEFMLSRVDESFVTGTYEEPSLIDPEQSVTRYRYEWGGNLTPRDVQELGIDPNTKPGRHMVGMYRMNNPDFGEHAQHVTFRTISSKSPSGAWIHPGIQGRYPARDVASWLENEYPRIMGAAMAADVERIRENMNDRGADT